MTRRAVLAIDEGTTNSKAVLVDEAGRIVAKASAPVPISHPRPGWVEQDANAIWTATCEAISGCLVAGDVDVVAIGISNQRESILIWDKRTGEPLGPVVTWQCRRTADACARLREAGHEADVIGRTGLPLDPMFPATKVGWLLAQCSGGDVAIGTVDSWLIWKLTGGKVHATDRSNAARTQLFNLAEARWDEGLCALFGVPIDALPKVHDSASIFGTTQGVGAVPDGVPIASAIGDSHAALFGHGAHGTGDGKVTFGTGSSTMTTIPDFAVPPPGITTTIAWSLEGRSTFAYEGNILVSASIFPWVSELLGLKDDVGAMLELAASVDGAGGAVLVPAHVGLGSPHWDAEARGLVCGLSFGTGRAQIARAAAESMAHQVADIFDAMQGARIGRLFVDGGPSSNRFLMQIVADFLGRDVTPCKSPEASAMGAAFLAGLATGFWPDLASVAKLAAHDAHVAPRMRDGARSAGRKGWRDALARTMLRTD